MGNGEAYYAGGLRSSVWRTRRYHDTPRPRFRTIDREQGRVTSRPAIPVFTVNIFAAFVRFVADPSHPSRPHPSRAAASGSAVAATISPK
jgi:hypothetical protein